MTIKKSNPKGAPPKYPPEVKLKALGMIHAGTTLNDITIELGVAYPMLLKWRRELKEGIDNKNITSLVDTEAIVVHDVAEQVAEDLIKLDPEQAEAIEGELLEITNGIDGYQVLATELQKVAFKLAKRISSAADDTPGADQIESLVSSLARLQEAFFNKNVTQVAVFGQGNAGSTTDVSKFKGLQKS